MGVASSFAASTSREPASRDSGDMSRPPDLVGTRFRTWAESRSSASGGEMERLFTSRFLEMRIDLHGFLDRIEELKLPVY